MSLDVPNLTSLVNQNTDTVEPVDSDSDSNSESDDSFTMTFTRSDDTWLNDTEMAENRTQAEQRNAETNQNQVTCELDEQVARALNLLAQKIDDSTKSRSNPSDECECALLQAKLQTADDELMRLKRTEKDLTNQVLSLTTELSTTQEKLRAANELLEERSQSLATERSFRLHLEGQLHNEKDNTLVAGSSLVRDLDEKLYMNTKVIALSGGKPLDITKALKKEAEMNQRYKKVTLVVGGNQVGDSESKIPDTIKAMKETVESAQKIAPSVEVCELPPRVNTPNAPQIIATLNNELEKMARETGCGFVATKDTFTLANGQPNDGYLMDDGIHLNERGATKLVEKLKIPLKNDASRKISKMAAYKNPSQSTGKSYAQATNNNATENKQPQYQQGNRLSSTIPPPRQVRTPQIHPKEQARQDQAERRRSGNQSPNRPAPSIREDGFCGYCGESGHRYMDCRHGGPVKCHKCQVTTHKAKFCSYYY